MNERRRCSPSLALVLVGLSLATLLGGCPPETLLIVDVQTDFVPGVEFDAIEVELDGAAAAQVPVSATDRYASPRHVLEAGGVSPGRHQVRVSLVAEGRRYTRTRLLDVERRHITLVVFSRSCIDVVCPDGGDPSATECVAGLCVDPACDEAAGEACAPTQCSAERPCDPLSTPCAEALCAEGICLAVPRAGGCAAGEFCHLEEGCVPLPSAADAGPVDAGVRDTGAGEEPRSDASIRDASIRDASIAEELDGFVAVCSRDDECEASLCESARCVSGRCVRESLCGAGEICCSGVCAVDCAWVPCAGKGAGALCRGMAGPCDVEEVCDGVSPTCPPDAFKPAGTSCGSASSSVCDGPDRCTGSSVACDPNHHSEGAYCDSMCRNDWCENGECVPASTPCPTPWSCLCVSIDP